MAYSNGRIYVDKSVTPNVGVSIEDLQQCFAVIIEGTVGGQTVRRLSADLGVIISKRTGDTFTDADGTTWRVVSRRELNPWARYRPIPCAEAGNNLPTPITLSQRMDERYGIDPPVDMFTADTIQAYEDYVNDMATRGAWFLPLRPFGGGHWKRLTDFVKTDTGLVAHNKGYDHNARPDNPTITITASGSAAANGTHCLAPLLPEHQRTLDIPPGTVARLHLPNDHTWLDFYYQSIHGTTTARVDVTDGNEEWLSPIDFMGTSTYRDRDYASVRRRIVVFKFVDSQWREEDHQYYDAATARWRLYNYATDLVGGTAAERPYDAYPNAWLDLTDAAGANNANCYYRDGNPFSPSDTHFFSRLTGRCLFLDCWVEGDSGQNVIPIVGFAYEVFISRSAGATVDVAATIAFVRVAEDESATYAYVLLIDYNPAELNLTAGLSDAGATVVPVLRRYYDALTVRLGDDDTAVNLLDTSLDYATDTGGEGDWFRIYCTVRSGQQASLGTSAVVSARRSGSSVTATKLLEIRRE